MQAFVRVFGSYPNVPADWISGIQTLDPDARVPIARANEMLSIAVTVTGDPALPLKAGRAATQGDAGALDYVMRSSDTVRSAFETAGRYTRLVNDALALELVVDGPRVDVKMQSAVKVSAAVEDFQLSSFFTNCVQPLIGNAAELEIWLTHPAPADSAEHRLTFPGAALRFDAPWSGYRFASSRLDHAIATADPNLNQILRVHLDRSLEETPSAHSLIERTRHLIRRELPRGHATAPRIARQLGMSRRTLCRRLEEEQTSFSAVLEDVRRGIALEQVLQGDLALSEIAFLLGFAQAAGFHRAFKRWTGQTPVEYRERRR